MGRNISSPLQSQLGQLPLTKGEESAHACLGVVDRRLAR